MLDDWQDVSGNSPYRALRGECFMPICRLRQKMCFASRFIHQAITLESICLQQGIVPSAENVYQEKHGLSHKYESVSNKQE